MSDRRAYMGEYRKKNRTRLRMQQRALESKRAAQRPPVVCKHCGTTTASRNRTKMFCGLECQLWSKIDRSGGPAACWLWTGGRTAAGYGNLTVRGEKVGKVYAHRLAWELLRGPIPEGMVMCHNCPGGDNPACVNPAHLFVGTPGDNAKDRDAKGRGRNGSTRTAPTPA